MIASPSIAFNDFSGSANDVTARQSKGRTVLTVKPRPTGAPSPSQIVSRNTLSRISRAYKPLSDSQQHAWEILAEHLRSKTVLGYSIKLTAHNAFVRLNCNRALAGEDILWDAPATKSIPLVSFATFYVNSEEVTVEEIQQPDDNYKLVVKMTGAMSTGVTNGWSKTVVISSAEDADWGDLDLTDAFAEVKGTSPEDELATCLYRAAEMYLPDHKLRTDYSDGDPDKEDGFYILQHTRCAAALTENGFQDSRESLQFLESPKGKKAIVALHVVGILAFIDAKPR